MEKRKILTGFLVLLVIVVLLALAARIWLEASGYEIPAVKSEMTKSALPTEVQEFLQRGITAAL